MARQPPRQPVQLVEAFHLSVLRVLETKLDRARYAVKGGINLRAWLGSARYSEDMDLDALGLEPHALEDRVDKVLASRDLALLLRMQTLDIRRITKPKQTETTQRWKLELSTTASAVPLRTKIEFSHRGSADGYVLEPVRFEIVRPYGIPAPTANHYAGASAARQKISALAHRATTQARDIWDLDHLFRVAGADPHPLAPALRDALPVAIERVYRMPFEDFKAQVVPFLDPEHQALFGTPEAWDRMRELVLVRLSELEA